MKPTDAHCGRVFEWKENRPNGSYVTVYVTLDRWTPNPGAQLSVLILETTYAFHRVGHVMTLRPNDSLWKAAKRIA